MSVVTRRRTSLLLLLAPMLGYQGVYGASPSSSSQTSSNSKTSVTPSSGDDVKAGDNIFFTTAAGIFQIPPTDQNSVSTSSTTPSDQAANSATGSATQPNASIEGKANSGVQSIGYCAPAGSRFQVQSITLAASTGGSANNPQKADTAIIQGYFPSREHSDWLSRLFHWPNKIPTNAPTAQAQPDCKTNLQWVALDSTYQFTSKAFERAGSQRLGFTWGGLVIPYKFYFTDRSIKGNPSTVAYVGYEGWFPGVSLAAVGSAGLGVAQDSSTPSTSTSSTTSGTSSPVSTPSPNSTTAATYTVAVGFIATFGGSIKAGVLFGRDYQGSAATFKYENKTWVALSVGAGF